MNKKQTNNIPKLKFLRQELRNNCTPAETALWKALKNKQLEGRKFRRQFSIENYIVDFYCSSEKLAIELDGSDHFTSEGIAYDVERTQFLNSLNIKVVKFENKEVFDNLESVIDEIKINFKYNSNNHS